MNGTTTSVLAKPLDLVIWSGGQTGSDRGALGWAMTHGVPHGGHCPTGRVAEDGPIPSAFSLREVGPGYRKRTERNIVESDGTVIITFNQRLRGGSRLTAELAVLHRKPLLQIHEMTFMPGRRLALFVQEHRIKILNVAGSRASKEPGIGQFVQEVLNEMAKQLTSI